MAKLIIQDQLKIKAPKIYPVDNGLTVFDAIKTRFSKLNISNVKLYLNNDRILHTDEHALLKQLSESDSVTVVCEVKGFVENFGNFLTPFVTGMFDEVGKLFEFLTPDIESPDTDKASPNNSYTSQTNTIRAFSQKALVCGSPVIYPDLIGEAIEFYSNNIKQSEQAFYVCFGELEGGTIQAANTNILRFPGAVPETFYPDAITKKATIPDYRVGLSVDEVDGQVMKGINEGENGTSYNLSDGSISSISGSTLTMTVPVGFSSAIALKAAYDAGVDYYNVEYERYDVGLGEFLPAIGYGTITSFTDDGSDFTIVVSDFTGPQGDGQIYGAIIVFTQNAGVVIGPFANPTQCEKMFFNIRFDRGLKSSVPIKVVVYQLDSKGGSRTGLAENFTATYTDDTLDEQYRTFEVNIANGRDWYEFTIERTGEATQDTTKPDATKLEKVFCIKELGDTEFDNATLLRVKMPATQIPTGSGADNKINIRGGQVKMPSYDVNTGTITPNAASRKMADAVLFIWKDFFQYDTALLNLDKLYAIQNKIDAINPELAQFDYTFDDIEMSVGDRLSMILNVARCQWFSSDGKNIDFWREESEQFDTALFSHADFAEESERSYSLTRSNFITGKYDAVQVEYIDRDSNKKAYIYRSINLDGTISDQAGINTKKVTVKGCQSLVNATDRADLEIRKMKYNTYSLTDTVIDSHRFIDKGAVILYNETYEGGDSFGGDITAINGGEATLSDDIELQDGVSYVMYYTDLYGEPVGPQTVTQTASNKVSVADLSQAYARGFDSSQIGSRYFITQLNDNIKRRYRIIERESSGYNIQFTMVNYDERVYENDVV